jgi:hypothetical protein
VLLNTSLTFIVDEAVNGTSSIKVNAPLEGAAHLSPVVSALSATKPAILQEQSQRIVLSLIAGVLHPRLNLSVLAGLLFEQP